MTPMLHIGNDKESMKETLKGIMTILDARDPDFDDKDVIIKALDVFGGSVEIKGVEVHDCNFLVTRKPKKGRKKKWYGREE